MLCPRAWRVTRRVPAFCAFLFLLTLSACGSTAVKSPSTHIASIQPTEPALAPPIPGSYAALGASETYGVGATPFTSGYAYLAARTLHARHFVDLGIPGTTLGGGYDTEMTSALAARPWLCTIFFGVNDITGRVRRQAFLTNLSDMVSTLRQARAQVLIVGLPDLSYVPAVRRARVGGILRIVSTWNTGMIQVARRTGAHFLDLRQFSRELASHPEYIAADGLHPSNRGHARIAAILVNTIRHDGLWRRA